MKKLLYILLGFNIIINAIFVAFHTVPNSDMAAYRLLFPHFFKNLIYIPSDTFIIHYPISYLLTSFFGFSGISLSLNIAVLVLMTIGGWILFYQYFLKTYIPDRNILHVMPAFLFINFSPAFYLYISHTFIRNIEFVLAFLLVIFFDALTAVSKQILCKVGIFSLLIILFISDPYFVYLFAVPLVLVLAIRSYSNRRYLPFVWLVIGAIASNSIIRTALNNTPYFVIQELSPRLVSLSQIEFNIGLTINGLLYLFNSFPRVTILSVMELTAVLIGLYGLWIMFKKGLHDKNHILFLLLPICFIITPVVYLFSDRPADMFTSRYLIFIVFILPVGICYSLAKLSSKQIGVALASGLAVLSLLNAIQISWVRKYPVNTHEFAVYAVHQFVIRTLNQHTLRYGYTSYWNAGINTFMSGNKIQFSQVTCSNHRVVPYRWLGSNGWFQKEYYTGKTFLLIDLEGNLTPELKGCTMHDLFIQFGKPLEIRIIPHTHDAMSLVIYNYNIAEKF